MIGLTIAIAVLGVWAVFTLEEFIGVYEDRTKLIRDIANELMERPE